MTENKPELLPCPFCGGEAVEKSWLHVTSPGTRPDTHYIIQCINECVSTFTSCCVKEETYIIWNARAPTQATSKTVPEDRKAAIRSCDILKKFIGRDYLNSKQRQDIEAAHVLLDSIRAALLTDDSHLVSALEKLACLGNGDKYGNSEGNIIAQEALAAHRSKTQETQ